MPGGNEASHVDTHIHVHQKKLTAEELEVQRQADEANENGRNKRKDEEDKTPAPISENPGLLVSLLKHCRFWRKHA